MLHHFAVVLVLELKLSENLVQPGHTQVLPMGKRLIDGPAGAVGAGLLSQRVAMRTMAEDVQLIR